jgi:hypothetical protein
LEEPLNQALRWRTVFSDIIDDGRWHRFKPYALPRILRPPARNRAQLVMDKITKDSQVASLRRQLRDMDAQRAPIEAQLAALLEQPEPARTLATPKPALPTGEKVALFRRLFAGRQDVFALRWENRKDGRSGYAPACANEWVAGVCGSPRSSAAHAQIKRSFR